MLKNNRGGTLVGIIIGSFILSVTIFGVTEMVTYNSNFIDTYNIDNNIIGLKGNALKIISELDKSLLNEGDIFYLYKDDVNKIFEIKTGSGYKNIDMYGNYIPDINQYDGYIYERILELNKYNLDYGDDSMLIDVVVNKINL